MSRRKGASPSGSPMVDLLGELIELDERGFVLPPDVEPDAFRESARRTLAWADAVRDELEREGRTHLFGETFAAEQLVPGHLLQECLEPVRAAYSISPLWVPAFFCDRHMPVYVGASTFYERAEEGFRVCLLLRTPFRQRRRWLIYDRDELVCHEACHVARMALAQGRFEEPLAYALSPSALRRAAGGAFSGRWEAPAVLAGGALLAAGAGLELAGINPRFRLLAALPLAGVLAFLGGRVVRAGRTLSAARRFLEPVFGPNAQAALFRCTDEEIRSLGAAFRRGMPADEWLGPRREGLRWQIISRRFLVEPG